MEKTRNDILGDIFQGGVTHGENGQFFTPESITQLLAQMTADPSAKTVCDPAVGSGKNASRAARISILTRSSTVRTSISVASE